jgi:POT family proton-dependent oligopeptide transporter
MPLFGAVVTDQYLGRYKTLQYSNIIVFFGHVVLTAAAIPAVIAYQQLALGVLIFGTVLMGVGFGGYRYGYN